MTEAAPHRTLDPLKFRDPNVTAKGEARASVDLHRLRTLWINTGTLCNLTCQNCYIESSPTNDRLAYISAAEAAAYLDELDAMEGVEEVGFTGGEPFMNPDFPAMLEDSLRRGYRALVLTNAMKPMMKVRERLLAIRERHGERLVMRVSMDHYSQALHEAERGRRSWAPALEGLRWLAEHGFRLNVAGRTAWNEPEEHLRAGFSKLFAAHGIPVDARDPAALVLFPEMDETHDVPEITTACWGILHVNPDDMMCSSQRMIVKRKGAARPAVVACTLLPYAPEFELGTTLADSARSVKLNHPHCAKFCVLGGGSCTG